MRRTTAKILQLWLAFSCAWGPSAASQASPPPPKSSVVCEVGQPQWCATPLAKGAQAPFDGQLISTDLAIQIAQQADGCPARIQAEVDRCAQNAAVAAKQAAQEKAAAAQDFATRLADTQAALERAQKLAEEQAPPWFAQPWFVAPVSAVVAAGVVVWALHH